MPDLGANRKAPEITIPANRSAMVAVLNDVYQSNGSGSVQCPRLLSGMVWAEPDAILRTSKGDDKKERDDSGV
jgi:hypothetical protein